MPGTLTEDQLEKRLATAQSRWLEIDKEITGVLKGLTRWQQMNIGKKFAYMRKYMEAAGAGNLPGGRARSLKQQKADLAYLGRFHKKLPGLFNAKQAADNELKRYWRMQSEMEYIPTPPSIEKPTNPNVAPPPEPDQAPNLDLPNVPMINQDQGNAGPQSNDNAPHVTMQELHQQKAFGSREPNQDIY